MPKFRALKKSFVDNHIREEGEVFEYTPPEGTTISDNLELVEEPKKGAKTKQGPDAGGDLT